jgi:hypothetical protein
MDPTKAVQNYNFKVTPERTVAQITPQINGIKDNAAKAIVSMAEIDRQVGQVCNGAGGTMCLYPFYLCFGREMWSLQRRGINGELFAAEAAVLIGKWTARGLSTPILQAIRSDVFNTGAPLAP